MNTPYQMNYRTPVTENWNHTLARAPEAVDEVSTMLERLKAESKSLESYFAELEIELKRVHLKRKVVSKKLGVLSELVKDVEALHATPSTELKPASTDQEPGVAAVPRRSRKKRLLGVGCMVLVALAITFIALEQTGHLSICMTCAPTRLLSLQ